MNDYKQIIGRAVATFVQSASAVVLADVAGILDVEVWRSAAVAGLVPAVTLLHRFSEAALRNRKATGAPLDIDNWPN
jgi:hypothetical protein